MTNIIPLAGIGSRFRQAGYLLPKPLIPVSGRPMIIRAIENLPPAQKWIFIVRQEHLANYALGRVIKAAIPEAIIVPVKKTTAGQAASVMLALPYLHPDESILVAACDNSNLYNQKRYQKLIADPTLDVIVWTFTKNKILEDRPEAWGWAKLEKDSLTVKTMSVKIPVSADPFNDHAAVATFYFKRVSEFAAAYKLMVKENYRVNGEFYVDSLPIFYKKLGKRSVIFDVDLYVSWGRPEDLYLYDELEYRYSQNLETQNDLQRRLWTRFFKGLK